MVLFCLKQWENNQRWNEYTAGFFRGSALTQPEHTVELITENFTRRRGKEKKEEKKKKPAPDMLAPPFSSDATQESQQGDFN